MRPTLAIAVFLFGAVLAPAQGIRLEPYSGELAYGLSVVPPWQDGGRLVINFPEHLEAGGDGSVSILRYYEKEPPGRWAVSADGRSAVLDVQSAKTPGVWVKARGKVSGTDRIEFVFTISNKSSRPLVMITPLYCHHYAGLSGFPQRTESSADTVPNFEHTYAFLGGQMVRMSSVSTRDPRAKVRGANAAGCPQPVSDFVVNHGGLLRAPVDAAISAITSIDGRRSLILAWTPGKSFLSNAEIPCVHADPYYGTIEPGESAQARGVLMLTGRPLEPAMRKLLKNGWGRATGQPFSH
jgi:hypothetical protein